MTTTKASLREFYGLDQQQEAPPAVPAKDAVPSVKTLSIDELTSTKSLQELMKMSTQRLSSVRDLYANRQGLIYNHHQELVGASETISQMHKELLDLKPSRRVLEDIIHSSDPGLHPPDVPAKDQDIDWRAEVSPVTTLPLRMQRMLKQGEGADAVAKAEAEYQTYLPALEAWVQAGVVGADELWQKCKDILRDAQHRP